MTQKRRFMGVVEDNIFWVATILAAVTVILFFRAASCILFPRNAEKPAEKSVEYEEFAKSCFGGDFILTCKSPKGGHCSGGMEKIIRNICGEMELLGAVPFGSVTVNLEKYDKCDDKMENQAGCMPNFLKGGEAHGREIGSIYLPARFFKKDEEMLKTALVHEISHALVSPHGIRTARLVDEFFAVYTQVQFLGKQRFYATCNGRNWNQAFLKTYGGDYVFPPKRNHKMMNLLSECRYGQLEYITRFLHKKLPFLYGALWNNFKKCKDGLIGTARLRQWIKAADREAGAIISRFNILAEADSSPRLAVIGGNKERCAFIYKNLSRQAEQYSAKASFLVEWRSSGRVLMWYGTAAAPEVCWSSIFVPAGGTVHIKAIEAGMVFNETFRQF